MLVIEHQKPYRTERGRIISPGDIGEGNGNGRPAEPAVAGSADTRAPQPTGVVSPKPSYTQFVPAVDQAARILFALGKSARGAATLTEICNAVGISKSKGLAILNTLRGVGLVTRSERSKAYALGPRVLALSQALLDHTDLVHEAAPYLDQLVAATGSTTLLGIIAGDRLFVVARREVRAGMGIAVHVGHRFPLTLGAHGKAILATLPEEELEEILAREPLYVYGEARKDSVDLDLLRAELAECRRLGYAHDLGVTRPGIAAVSAVVVDEYAEGAPDGMSRVAGCLIVVGTFAAEAAAEYGQMVAAAAREMSARAGSLP
ncbi:MAG: IclR family transcriptional regulator [Actinobacteria bacterium]|nr:IclR family transcriptional regulator [Actinomycetota bacterium]